MNKQVISHRGLLLWSAALGLLLGPTLAASLRLWRGLREGQLADMQVEHNLGAVLFPVLSRQEEAQQVPRLASWEFTLDNPWPDRPWHVKLAHRSCGCLEASVLSEEVPPGGQARVRVGVGASRVVEKRREYVILETDHPVFRTVACILEAELLPEIAWHGSSHISLGRRQDPTHELTVFYHTTSSTPPEPFALTADRADVIVQQVQALPSRPVGNGLWRHGRRFRVRLAGEATAQLLAFGHYSCTVTAQCGEKKSDMLQLSFSMPKVVDVKPEAVFLLGDNKQQIEVTADTPIKLASIDGPAQMLLWNCEPSSDGRMIRIDVQRRATATSTGRSDSTDAGGRRTVRLRLRFMEPEELDVTVPVYVLGS
ncbi:MAG: hypothetical protein KatS3mg110_2883 [Pirellulaceae bacterium]|nr:MAG: hypothetical protein KatS3mg110_2883 [Pirellulaceae bacterium]